MIAIVQKNESFSDGWIDYCLSNGIEFKTVNPYADDLISQLGGCEVFMWHWHQSDYRDRLIAISVIRALEAIGIKCFPNLNTCLHFDDKIAQKYLLEAKGASLVPSYVFYDKQSALAWLEGTTWPKVFKLRGGAGASNVKLVSSYREAKRYVLKAFSSGFAQYRNTDAIKEALCKKREGVGTWREVFRCIYYLFNGYKTDFARFYGNESGYIYAQEFIPNNDFDIRVCVVSGKAFALKRMCRKNDFRASGSGKIIYDVSQIDIRCVENAFSLNRKLKMQSIAIDYVFDLDNTPKVVEISYGFAASAYTKCEGYWTENMEWHPGTNFDFCGWMVQSCIEEYEQKKISV